MSVPSNSIDQRIADAAEKEIKAYFESSDFKDAAKKEYTTQITALIEGAEKKARFWAIVVSILISGIALVLVSSEFFKVKEKRLSIDEEYVKVLTTAQELHRTIDGLKDDTGRLKENVESKVKTVEGLEKKTNELETRISQAVARVDKKK